MTFCWVKKKNLQLKLLSFKKSNSHQNRTNPKSPKIKKKENRKPNFSPIFFFSGSIDITSIIQSLFSSGGNSYSALRISRLFCVLRVLRFLDQFEGLGRQTKSIMASVSSVVWLLFLLVLVLFTFGILGTSTFGRAGKLMLNGNYYGWSHLYMVRADQSLLKVFVFHYFCFEGSNSLLSQKQFFSEHFAHASHKPAPASCKSASPIFLFLLSFAPTFPSQR